MKYLVMECKAAYAVVLGDDGSFLKVANMRYQVGQTVTDVIPLNLPEVIQQPKPKRGRWISAFAAMAACLALLFTTMFFAGQMPYASVYMTINPEVRIDVNRSDIVVGVEGMNGDGAALLNGYAHKNKDLDTVMDELVDRAIGMGYLHEGGKITLSLDADEEWVIRHSDHLNDHLNEYLTEKITVTIDIEQKQPAQTIPTAPTGTIVIPVGPGSPDGSDYGEEDESNDGSTSAADSGYGQSDYADSDYDDPDYDSSDYDDPENVSQTDYGNGAEDAGESDYEDPSDYGDADDDASDYGEGDSSYEDSDYDEE